MNTIGLSNKIESQKLRLVKNSHISQKKKLEKCFEKYAKKTLVFDLNGKKITYQDFLKDSLKLVNFFRNKGLKKGSKILISSDRCLNYLLIFTACLFGQYVVCPVDPSLKEERLEELKKMLNFDYVINNANELDFKNNSLQSDFIDYDDSDFLIIYSSGTTGDAKGILFSSDSFLKSSESFSNLAGYNEEIRIFHCLPMFYMAGVLNTFFSCLFSGTAIILGNEISVLNILSFWEKPKKYEANSLHLTPSIVGLLCEMYRQNPEVMKHVKNYKSIISTGSYLYPEIQEKFYKIFNKRISSCYGVTELGGPLTIQSWEDTFIEHCVGLHADEVKIKISKDQNKLNSVMINSPFMMKGYVGHKGLEKAKLNNGFYDTEDIGSYEKGLLFIHGRTRDIIKKGGELISLPLIERVVLKFKNVIEAAAVGKKSLISGEDLYLFVTIKGEFKLENKIQEIKEFLKKKLRPIEIPKKIIIVPQLPKTSNGKIKKRDIIDLYTI